MGLFGIDSKSSATDNTIDASGAYSTVLAKNKINTGVSNSKVNTGISIQGAKLGKGATISFGDPNAAQELADQANTFSQTITDTGNKTLTEKVLDAFNTASQTAALQTALSKVPTTDGSPVPPVVSTDYLNGLVNSALSQSGRSPVATSSSKWLWAAGVALAIVAVAFLFRKMR